MPDLWPWIALGCWCFGFTAGIAWAAQYRPTIIRIATTVENRRDACAIAPGDA